MNNTGAKLDKLVKKGTLLSYSIVNFDADGYPGNSPEGRNTEQLTLCFSDGEKLVLSTWCSGCAENSGFSVDS